MLVYLPVHNIPMYTNETILKRMPYNKMLNNDRVI